MMLASQLTANDDRLNVIRVSYHSVIPSFSRGMEWSLKVIRWSVTRAR
jgi:hypothetical protein